MGWTIRGSNAGKRKLSYCSPNRPNQLWGSQSLLFNSYHGWSLPSSELLLSVNGLIIPWGVCPLKMGPICSPETSVSKHLTPHNNSQVGRIHFQALRKPKTTRKYRGSFPGQDGRRVNLTAHFHAVLRLRMSGVLLLLPLYVPSWRKQGKFYLLPLRPVKNLWFLRQGLGSILRLQILKTTLISLPLQTNTVT
jgi:hypothetical protein